jgi:hypothetical protein
VVVGVSLRDAVAEFVISVLRDELRCAAVGGLRDRRQAAVEKSGADERI